VQTPVALIIFNRPEATARVFEQVARARPPTLLIIADGPRPDRPGEQERCAAARAVVERVDWKCDVLRNYSDVNLGVGVRPATGLRWVFDHVETSIVLEDDCVPHPSFFRFCDEMLDYFRDDERIMHVSGDNWHFTPGGGPFSYFFSRYCYSCGWATWRRAFKHYDPELRLWPELRDTSWLVDLLGGDRHAAAFWASLFERTHTAGVEKNGWDWAWLFACWAHNGLSVLPSTNLITNIGFDGDATHTVVPDERAYVPSVEMTFPLRHPPCMVRNVAADLRIATQVGANAPGSSLLTTLRRARDRTRAWHTLSALSPIVVP
jgi:hypothetical protein